MFKITTRPSDEVVMIQGRKTKTAELAEKLKEKLLTERLPKDSPVMSVRELAEHFNVSTNTAARILNLLVSEDFLYHKQKSGTFIKNDPPVIPVIAYAGPLPDPENTDPLVYDASFRLLKHFSELGIEPVLISYYELRHPGLAAQKLRKTNGLLIHAQVQCFGVRDLRKPRVHALQNQELQSSRQLCRQGRRRGQRDDPR